jgi:hypothetical protein
VQTRHRIQVLQVIARDRCWPPSGPVLPTGGHDPHHGTEGITRCPDQPHQPDTQPGTGPKPTPSRPPRMPEPNVISAGQTRRPCGGHDVRTIRTASAPSEASPTRSMSGSVLKIIRNPAFRALSSAMTTRSQMDAPGRCFPGRRRCRSSTRRWQCARRKCRFRN